MQVPNDNYVNNVNVLRIITQLLNGGTSADAISKLAIAIEDSRKKQEEKEYWDSLAKIRDNTADWLTEWAMKMAEKMPDAVHMPEEDEVKEHMIDALKKMEMEFMGIKITIKSPPKQEKTKTNDTDDFLRNIKIKLNEDF